MSTSVVFAVWWVFVSVCVCAFSDQIARYRLDDSPNRMGISQVGVWIPANPLCFSAPFVGAVVSVVCEMFLWLFLVYC